MNKLFKKCIAKIREFFGKQKSSRTKAEVFNKDVVIGLLQTMQPIHLEPGVKVITREGIANVVQLKKGSWIVLSYKSGRKVEKKPNQLWQYYVMIHDNLNDTDRFIPLSYADYKYIHPNKDDNNGWVEGIITKKKYFQLIDEEREQRAHYPAFNNIQGGINILNELEDLDLELVTKHNKLLIHKSKK